MEGNIDVIVCMFRWIMTILESRELSHFFSKYQNIITQLPKLEAIREPAKGDTWGGLWGWL
jgi:hypothetical protein